MEKETIEFCTRIPEKHEYFKLFESTGWNEEYGLDEEQLHATLLESWYLVAAYHSGRLVALGRTISDGILHALIVDMIVHPDYQNRGVRGALLDQLVERCHASGIRDIQLFCARGKADFYRKHGFRSRPLEAPGMEWKPDFEAMSHEP